MKRLLKSITIIKPNGRFELNTKVCLSITGFHPEYWQPAWGSKFERHKFLYFVLFFYVTEYIIIIVFIFS